jgi:hypothetical protein
MADRYWVNGAGTWDATTTTNWATTSGGAGGASAPTSADNVIFDSLSNATLYTVTVGTNAVCNDLTAAGPLVGNVTFSWVSTSRINCHGSMTLPATGITWTSATSSQINFSATTTGKTITTNGVSLGSTNIALNGIGGAWTLGSAYTSTAGLFIVTNGTLNTGNFNITAGAFAVNVAGGTQVINLGSSTVTLSASASITFSQTAGLTFNAGTSQINCSTASPTFAGGGQTFYNVSFTSAGNGTTTITGANTFNDLNQISRSATGTRIVSLGANQTVSGTLTLGAANTSIRRIQVQSDIIGTQRTITLNGSLATLADCDFRDISAAGSVGTWTGTRLGNGLGNSGITFDAAKDVYWNLAAGGVWTATAWALSSGGAVDANNFPLAQDKVIIENTGLDSAASISVSLAVYWFGELDISTRTLPMTFASGSFQAIIYKNVTLSSAVTMTGTGAWNFNGQGTTQILDVNTATFTPPFTIDSPTGTLQLAENTTCSGTVTLASGTLSLNNFNLTCLIFSSSNTNTRVIAFGTGKIVVTGNNVQIVVMTVHTNFSYTGTSQIELSYSGSTGTRSIACGVTGSGATESTALNYYVTAGTDIINVTGNTGTNVYRTLDFTGFSGTITNAQPLNIYRDLTFSTGMTLSTSTSALNFVGTSGTQLITTNVKTLDFLVVQNGVGGTVQLQDNLTMASTRTFTLTNGSLNVNGRVFTTGIFSSSNVNTRTINLGTNGKIAVNGGNWTTTTTTGLTLSGTGTISMDFATAKTFAGGGGVYPFTLNQGGAGTLSITGANTFANMTNTVQPTTITFAASTTTTFSNFNVNGTAGNLVTLNSSSPGTQFTLLETSLVVVNYLDIIDSAATPANTWYALDSTDSGNNTGWIFNVLPPASGQENPISLRSFTEYRRF